MSRFDVKGHSLVGAVWGSGHSLGSGVTVWGRMTIFRGSEVTVWGQGFLCGGAKVWGHSLANSSHSFESDG